MACERGSPALISDPNGPRSSYAWLRAGRPCLCISVVHVFDRNPVEVSGFCLGDIATSATFPRQKEETPFLTGNRKNNDV